MPDKKRTARSNSIGKPYEQTNRLLGEESLVLEEAFFHYAAVPVSFDSFPFAENSHNCALCFSLDERLRPLPSWGRLGNGLFLLSVASRCKLDRSGFTQHGDSRLQASPPLNRIVPERAVC